MLIKIFKESRTEYPRILRARSYNLGEFFTWINYDGKKQTSKNQNTIPI